ncbi:thiamine biosynthesis lipoprotein ApbE [Pasteurella canis]|uniref:FAD:protein FMN transferase n=2 Tax=Pasteurella canis TaxID=753 RepID=A0A379EX99_9PAST|nr:FAD:protein FMN transferase [Pasteurella canis]SUC10996.1 thiamine biosynthesis lipoprotein ApbE [Pasteurella canis]
MKLQKMMTSALVAFSTLLLVACEKSPEMVTLTGKTMGTTYSVKYVDNGQFQIKSEAMHAGIESVLRDVNNKMSTYIASSELSMFNQYTQIDTPIEISADLATVLAESIRLNKVTDGALDVTIGPIVNLWGFGPEKRTTPESMEEQLEKRRAWVGIEKLVLTQEGEKFFLQKAVPQLYIDLSSIAKGFGVDKVAAYVSSQGADNYLVEIGGEIRAKGKNLEGKDWQIAIEKPSFDGSRAVSQIIGLKNLAMATSGNYRNYFEENGRRFSHEIDPKTGYPIDHRLASITVLADSTMTADGLSTGLYVLGEEKALEVAEKYNLLVYLITKTEKGFEARMSSAFEKLLNSQH